MTTELFDLEPEPEPEGAPVKLSPLSDAPSDALEPEPAVQGIHVSPMPTRPTLVPATPKQAQEGALVTQRTTLIGEALAIKVTNDATYQRAIQLAQVLTGWIKDAEAHFAPDIEAANKLHKSLVAKRKEFTGELEACLTQLKALATGFYQEQQRRQLAERQRLDAEARQREEEARLERKRQADELAKAGKFGEAVSLLAKTMPAPSMPAPVQTTLPIAAGATQRAKWSYELTDKAAFIAAVARPRVLRELADHLLEQGTPAAIVAYIRELAAAAPVIPTSTLEEFPSALRMAARAEGESLNWPGVKFFNQGSLAVRATE
jgi:hypothetical protein